MVVAIKTFFATSSIKAFPSTQVIPRMVLLVRLASAIAKTIAWVSSPPASVSIIT